jgi:hypothetical protein
MDKLVNLTQAPVTDYVAGVQMIDLTKLAAPVDPPADA